MSRIINPNSAGKQRTSLKKVVAFAIRSLSLTAYPDEELWDIAAFIIFGLDEIAATIDNTVAAWEKRGYWVKADKFRIDWAWAESLACLMRDALISDDWCSIFSIAEKIEQHLGDVSISSRYKPTFTWQGAYQKFMSDSHNNKAGKLPSY